MLEKVEDISLFQCNIPDGGSVYETILKYCTNLERLLITRNHWIDCLPQKYPALLYLNLKLNDIIAIDILLIFFDKNPHVKNLQLCLNSISGIGHTLCDSKIKLNRMSIIGVWTNEESIELINKLRERGLYERLHIFGWNKFDMSLVVKIKNLVSLYTDIDITIPSPMPNIKEGFL